MSGNKSMSQYTSSGTRTMLTQHITVQILRKMSCTWIVYIYTKQNTTCHEMQLLLHHPLHYEWHPTSTPLYVVTTDTCGFNLWTICVCILVCVSLRLFIISSFFSMLCSVHMSFHAVYIHECHAVQCMQAISNTWGLHIMSTCISVLVFGGSKVICTCTWSWNCTRNLCVRLYMYAPSLMTEMLKMWVYTFNATWCETNIPVTGHLTAFPQHIHVHVCENDAQLHNCRLNRMEVFL